MNPICQTDINNPDCQLWMSKVCEHCRELYAKEASAAWAAWWHDDTPPVYKEVTDMTVYDCNKLKNLLELEVAALESKIPTISLDIDDFELWQTILFIAVYIAIIVVVVMVYYFWRQRRRVTLVPCDDKENIEDRGSPQDCATAVSSEKEAKPSEPKIRNWVRQKARPIFLHNEAALRRQHQRYREKERLREAYIQEHIEKWTKAHRKIEKKNMDKSKEQEENEVTEPKE